MAKNTIRATLALALCCVSFCVLALTQSSPPGDSGEPSGFSTRLGDDDGAVMAILFGANLRGNLEMCDCTHPRGGLARRVGYLEGFKAKFPQTPVIQLEAGQFLYNPEGYQDAIMLQNEQVARAYTRWPVDVINLSRNDLIWARKMLVTTGLPDRVAALPMLKNLISANGLFDAEVTPPAPFLVREITGPRIKGRYKKLRIGFVGLAAPIKPSAGTYDGTVKNMFEAGRRSVLQARKQCDILVIVAHAEFEPALKLATENPEADVVIAGDAETVFKTRQVGKTTVVCAAPGNTEQGDLRLYIAPDGRFSFKFISTNLDAGVPADPAALAYVAAARAELDRFKNR